MIGLRQADGEHAVPVLMSEDAIEPVEERLKRLEETRYPLGVAFKRMLEDELGQAVGVSVGVDPFAHNREKEAVDRMLVDWITGRSDDQQCLNRRVLYRAKYAHGSHSLEFLEQLRQAQRKAGKPTSEEIDLEELVTPFERSTHSFAKAFHEAWRLIFRRVPDEVKDRHLELTHELSQSLPKGFGQGR